MKPHPVTVTTTIEVTEQLIADLLCTWYESGYSNFWIREIEILENPVEVEYTWEIPLRKGKLLVVPIDGGADPHARGHILDRDTLTVGMQRFAERYPHLFGKIMKNDDHDANDADVFVQCCLFGEEVYC